MTFALGLGSAPRLERPKAVAPTVGGGTAAAHVGTATVSSMRVTAALWASRRPSTATLAPAEIEVKARMLPTKCDDAPSVAELPTCQKTLQACALPMRFT
jgi:hypothetical protein